MSKSIGFGIGLYAQLLSASPISGVYDAGWNSYFRTSSEWQLALARIDSIAGGEGQGTLIIQYGTYEDASQHLAYLPLVNSWFNSTEDRSALGVNLQTAIANWSGSLWLGLAYDDEGWNTAGAASATTLDTLWLKAQLSHSLNVWHAWKQLLPNRGKQFYIPNEIARYFWIDSVKRTLLVKNFLQPLLDSLHQQGDLAMIAPYGNASLESATDDSLFLSQLLANWRPDIVQWQDGVGAGHMTIDQSAKWSRALQGSLAQLSNRLSPIPQFWSDLEIFDSPSDSANLARIDSQIQSVQPYVSKIVAYDFSSLVLDQYAMTMKPLYSQLLSIPVGIWANTNLNVDTLKYNALGQIHPQGQVHQFWRFVRSTNQEPPHLDE